MKNFFGTEPKIGYCPLSMRLGAGARGWRADGRAGRVGAGRGRRRSRGRRQRRAGAQALGQQALGRQALGRAGARQGERVRGARGLGVAWALGARPGRLGWPGLCTWCTRPFLARFDSVFS